MGSHQPRRFGAAQQVEKLFMQRYEVGAVIGQGAVGVVHAGHQRGLERAVAIKILRAELAQDDTARRRFIEEARVCAGLHEGGGLHPGIVQVYEVVEEFAPGSDPDGAGRPAIVMELLRGETLRDRLMRGALPPDDAKTLISAMLDALSHVHSCSNGSVVHRDIKPANIFLCEAGRIVLTDFGIARVIGAAGLTKTNGIVGTVEYMSPEQAEGKPVDARSDLYACGVVLHETLAGHLPFSAETPVAVALQHLHKTPPPLPSHVPLPLRRAVTKALAKDPSKRFQSAREFAEALDATPKTNRKAVVASVGTFAASALLLLFASMPRTQIVTKTAPIAAPAEYQCAANARCDTLRAAQDGAQQISERVTFRWGRETAREVVGAPVIVRAATAPQVRERRYAEFAAIVFTRKNIELKDKPTSYRVLKQSGKTGQRAWVVDTTYEDSKKIAEHGQWRTVSEPRGEVLEIGTKEVAPAIRIEPRVPKVRVEESSSGRRRFKMSSSGGENRRRGYRSENRVSTHSEKRTSNKSSGRSSASGDKPRFGNSPGDQPRFNN